MGSYGKFAEFKAEVINSFVAAHGIRQVLEFGCGDGHQVGLARYPMYVGFDVSETAVIRCRRLFARDSSKRFAMLTEYANERAELTLSLDVVYHLVEDDLFEEYMRRLFGASDRFVILYSSDTDDNRGYEQTHVRHRKVTAWIARHEPHWQLVQHIPNRYPFRGDYREGSFADFFVYERRRPRE